MEKSLTMFKSFWNSWIGLLTQMVIFMLLGAFGALLVSYLTGY